MSYPYSPSPQPDSNGTPGNGAPQEGAPQGGSAGQQWQPYGQPSPYGQSGPYGQPVPSGRPAPVNVDKSLSIASLVIGIASFFGFGFFVIPQIVGVVLGHIGLKREPTGRGLAIAGLIINYLALLIMFGFILFMIWAVSNAPTTPTDLPSSSLHPLPSSSPSGTGRVI